MSAKATAGAKGHWWGKACYVQPIEKVEGCNCSYEQGKNGVRCDWSKTKACQRSAEFGEESALLQGQWEALKGFTECVTVVPFLMPK